MFFASAIQDDFYKRNSQSERMSKMKSMLISVLGAIVAINVAFAQEARIVALVVQDHADKPCAEVPILALTDALTAKLAGSGLQVINPYNSVGVNQNRDARGERTPDVSAMDLARKFKADGAITATVTELLDNTNGDRHEFSIRIILSLADAWTGAAVVQGANISKESEPYTSYQVSHYKRKYLNDFMYSAADECAVKLKKNTEFQEWLKKSAHPGGEKWWERDPEFKNWIKSIVDGKLADRERGPEFKKLIESIVDQADMLPKGFEHPKTFDDLVDKMVGEMMSNSAFSENYKELKETGGRRPIVVFGKLTNSSKLAKFDVGLKVASERFLKKLYDSKMFDITDDSVKVDLAKRIIRSSIIEDPTLMNEWKSHNSPDLFIEGEFYFRNELDDTEYFDLIVKMHRLRKPGGVVWFGISTYPVKKEVSK